MVQWTHRLIFCMYREVFAMRKALRLLAAVFTVCVLLSCAAFAAERPSLAESRYPGSAAVLYDCGFLTGTAQGLELTRSLTRAEAAALIVRVTGDAEDLIVGDMPFTDVASWAAPYVSKLYSDGIVRGVSQTRYGSGLSVTAQQFYTMLLRALGYTDASFSYDSALEFAVSRGLLAGEDLSRVRKSFTRDDAMQACYMTLNAVPEGETEPYAFVRARRIENSYDRTTAEVVTGTNAVYNALSETLLAVQSLDSYTIVQHGRYRTGDSSSSIDSRLRIFSREQECWYTIDVLDDGKGITSLARSLEVYSDTDRVCVYEEGMDGEWDTANLTEELSRRYTGIYERLFGPDLDYALCFDYALEDGTIVLSGFSDRFELLADPTSDLTAAYYFDVTIRIDADTRLPISVVCTYRDTWEESGKAVRVSYSSEFSLEDVNSTQIPEDTHGLNLAD